MLPLHAARRRIIIACNKLSSVGLVPAPLYDPILARYVEPPKTVCDVPADRLEAFVSQFEHAVEKVTEGRT